jgi:hypothetical protein
MATEVDTEVDTALVILPPVAVEVAVAVVASRVADIHQRSPLVSRRLSRPAIPRRHLLPSTLCRPINNPLRTDIAGR